MSLCITIIYDVIPSFGANVVADGVCERIIHEYMAAYQYRDGIYNRALFNGHVEGSAAIAIFFPHLVYNLGIFKKIQEYITKEYMCIRVIDTVYNNGFDDHPYSCIPEDCAMVSLAHDFVLIDKLDPKLGVHSQMRVTYSICIQLFNIYRPEMYVRDIIEDLSDTFDTLVCMHTSSMNQLYVLTFLRMCDSLERTNNRMDDEHKSLVYGTLSEYSYISFERDEIIRTYKSVIGNNEDFNRYFIRNAHHASLMEAESILKMYDEDMYMQYKSIYIMSYILSMVSNKSYDGMQIASLCTDILRLLYMTEYRETSAGNKLYCFKHSGWQLCEGYGALSISIGNISTIIEKFASTEILVQVGMSRVSLDEFKRTIHTYLSKRTNRHNVIRDMKTHLIVKDCSERRLTYSNTITFGNGTYDLKLRRFRETYPHDLNAYIIGYDYYKPGSNPSLEEDLDDFMATIFPCKETREYVYIVFSRCFEGTNAEKGIWFFIGHTNAGKSKFMDLIATAFGDYSTRLHAKMFNDNNKQASQATTALNQTIGKLVGVIQEPPKTNYNVEVMKEYSGETTLSARWMYKESTQIRNSIRYFCCANATNMSTSDAAFWRRLQVVQFEVQFLPPEEYYARIEELKGRFYCNDYRRRFDTLEEELKLYGLEDPHLKNRLDRLAPVLMSRFIRYYTDPSKSSIELRSFKVIRNATSRFRIANDPVFRFVKYRVDVSRTPEQRTTMTETIQTVYTAFTSWYETNTHGKRTTMNMSEFVGILVTMGFEVYGEGYDQVVHGMKIRPTIPTITNAQFVHPHRVNTIDEQKAAQQLGLSW